MLELNNRIGGGPRQFSNCSVEEGSEEDAVALSSILRQSDIDELRYYDGATPQAELLASVRNAKICMSIKDHSSMVIAMFGVGWTFNPRVGRIWLLSSDSILQIRQEFLRHCRAYVDEFLVGHDVLFNHVDDENHLSKRWLQWIGFEKTGTMMRGASRKFIEFSKFRDEHVRLLYLTRNWNEFRSSIAP